MDWHNGLWLLTVFSASPVLFSFRALVKLVSTTSFWLHVNLIITYLGLELASRVVLVI